MLSYMMYVACPVVLLYELFLARSLQVPIQNRVKVHRYRTSRRRPWKSSREKPSIEQEVPLNQCHMLTRPNKLSAETFWMRQYFGVLSLYEAWKIYFAVLGLRRRQLVNLCSKFSVVPVLVLLWSQKYQKIHYKKQWATQQARYLVLSA